MLPFSHSTTEWTIRGLECGKIDRKTLRSVPLNAIEPEGNFGELNEAERVLVTCARRVLEVPDIDLDDDFFLDLGGHSLLAARFVTAVRAQGIFRTISLQDVYSGRALRKIAEILGKSTSRESAAQAVLPHYEGTPWWRRFTCGLLQLLCLPVLITYGMARWLGAYFFYHYLTRNEGDSILVAAMASMAAYVFLEYTSLGIAVVVKRAILPRLRPGEYALWGFTYFRWWLVRSILRSAPTYILHNSPLYPYYLRALGATVGRNTFLSSFSVEAPELLTIGDGTSIGASTVIANVHIEKGRMLVGPVEIGRDCYVGTSAVLLGHTKLEDMARLGDLSSLKAKGGIPALQEWAGTPVAYHSQVDPTRWRDPLFPSKTHHAMEIPLYLLMAALGSILTLIPIFTGFIWLDTVSDHLQYLTIPFTGIQLGDIDKAEILLLSLPSAGVMIILTILLIVILRRLLLPVIKPGAYSIHPRFYYRKWFVDLLLQQSLSMLHALYATIFTPIWLRMLGASVGREAEVSTASGVTPGLLKLGDETFVADTVNLGDDETFHGWLDLKATELESRSFVGNGACIAQGSTIKSGSLIGVQSVNPPPEVSQPHQTWFGSPPILLPNRQVFSQFAPMLTYRPHLRQKIARGIVEIFRICVPQALIVAAGYTTVLDLFPILERHHWTTFVFSLGFAGSFIGCSAFFFVAGCKWLFVGRYNRKEVPMWTRFVWFSEAVTNLYESTAVPLLLEHLIGTPFLAIFLRLLGVNVGLGVYLGTTDLTEFDCVTIGDYAELNVDCGPQTHLFEDRVMKIDHISIGAGATLGPRSIVLYGATVENGATLGPLSLVMKGELIPACTSWEGSPARLADETSSARNSTRTSSDA